MTATPAPPAASSVSVAQSAGSASLASVSWDRRDLLALGGVALAWLMLLAFGTHPLSLTLVDDAYIYLRVIDNLLDGKGWTYNTDDVVNPLTSPLFPLLLAPIRALGASAEATLLIAYGCGVAAIAVLQFAAFRTQGRLLATVMAMATSAGAVVVRSPGMETSSFLACILGAALAYQKRRPVLAGLLAGATALARPEGAAMIVVLTGLELLRTRRLPWRMMAWSAVPVVPWLVYSQLTFGSIVPHTVAIKAIQTSIGYWAQQPAWVIAFFGQARVLPVTLLLFAIGLVVAWRRMRAGEPYALAVIGFGVAQIVGYTVLRAPAGYLWYYAPGSLAIDTGVVLGLFEVGAMWRRRRSGGAAPAPLAGWRVAGAGLLALALMTQVAASRGRGTKAYQHAGDYLAVGSWIAMHCPADVRVACTEIGYLGYYSHRAVRDIHGLIHLEALEPLRQARWDWWFDDHPPEVIVVHEPSWHGEPSPDYWTEQNMLRFASSYRRVFVSGAVAAFVAEGTELR